LQRQYIGANWFAAPIYWCYKHCSTNILVLHVLAAPIYWFYDVCSTNILLLLVLAAPIGEDTQTFYNFKNFRGFFQCLHRQYIGANWFAAPIYWRSTRRIKMFAAPHLFGQTLPIQSAGVSGSGNRIIPRWRPN
jgi:hypothetical protein